MDESSESEVIRTARRARAASADLAVRTRAEKDRALHAIADALLAESPRIVAANAEDTARAREAGISAGFIDRDDEPVGEMALYDIARHLDFLCVETACLRPEAKVPVRRVGGYRRHYRVWLRRLPRFRAPRWNIHLAPLLC